MDSLDKSRKGEKRGRLGALLLEDLLNQKREKILSVSYKNQTLGMILEDSDLHSVDDPH